MKEELIYIAPEDTADQICPFKFGSNTNNDNCHGTKCMAWVSTGYLGRCGRINTAMHINVPDSIYVNTSSDFDSGGIESAISELSDALHSLGLNRASGTRMGAIELLAKEIKDGFEALNSLKG